MALPLLMKCTSDCIVFFLNIHCIVCMHMHPYSFLLTIEQLDATLWLVATCPCFRAKARRPEADTTHEAPPHRAGMLGSRCPPLHPFVGLVPHGLTQPMQGRGVRGLALTLPSIYGWIGVLGATDASSTGCVPIFFAGCAGACYTSPSSS